MPARCRRYATAAGRSRALDRNILRVGSRRVVSRLRAVRADGDLNRLATLMLYRSLTATQRTKLTRRRLAKQVPHRRPRGKTGLPRWH
jgi:hypothetical protein